MKLAIPALALLAALSLAPGPGERLHAQEATIHAKSVVHADGTRTETQTNLEERTLEEKTLDAKGKLLRRSTYKLDEYGQPTEGTHYNAKNAPVNRSVYTRDSLGRISEEKSYSLDGKLLQRRVFRFGSNNQVIGIDAYDAGGNLLRGSGGSGKKPSGRRGR